MRWGKVKFITSAIALLWLTASAVAWPQTGTIPEKTGFLVVAPDRGFLGNREIMEAFSEFEEEYQARRAFIGLYENFEKHTEEKLNGAIGELIENGADRIVVLPMMLSSGDPYLKKALKLLHLKTDASGVDRVINRKKILLDVAKPMGEDILIAQILEDRIREYSKNPVEEKLIVATRGAMNEEEVAIATETIEKLIAKILPRLSFSETDVVVFYSGAAEADRSQQYEEEVETLIRSMAARPGRTLLIPFHLEYHHTESLGFRQYLHRMVADLSTVRVARDLFPHPNIGRWLRKEATAHLPLMREQVGVVVMAVGGWEVYHEAVRETVRPLRSRYNLEIAFGMADPGTLQEAIEKVERRGARWIVVVRLLDSAAAFREKTEAVLGVDRTPSFYERVRSGAHIVTLGGIEADPLVAEILLDRIKEISREPSNETVILVGYGAGTPDGDARWHKQMERTAQLIQERVNPPFKAITWANLRKATSESGQAATALRERVEAIQEAGGVA
ncbi:MAG: CbiX/SirB N-terminal domain-containing protein, partial [Nitrospiria bacterium]